MSKPNLKVVQLPRVQEARDEHCRELLEEVIARQKDERLNSVAVLVIRANGDVVTSYHVGEGSAFTVVGALDMLKRRVLDEQVERS